jgi:hypothetical protein
LFTWKEANEKKFSKPISLYSFDLSAATDRLPIILQKVLLSPFLTSWGAELWGCLMVGRKYHCPKTYKSKGGPRQTISELGYVQYATGQPMGALSSWAMLAFLHHAIVQWSALRAGVLTTSEPWYEGYAVLGDDVVIARDCVAKEYAGIMKALDVGIGDHKSLISRSGKAMEFAKRTFLDGVNVSMVPFTEFVVARQSLAGLLELVRKYSLSFGQMLSVLGYGYRAKASASKRLFSLPKRLRNYIITFYGPGGPGYTGLRGWLPLKSVTSLYKTSVTRVQGLCRLFFESEVKLILEFLDSYQPLIKVAKRLGTVYRDREHYGTAPRGLDRQSSHQGIESTTPSEVVDSLNETVYREAFLDAVVASRDLRTKLEEISLDSLDWESLENLWTQFREIETEFAALPFPRNIQTRVSGGKPPTSESKMLKRWYRYSSTFRATVDPVNN